MEQLHIEKIATELHLMPKQVQATAALLDEGATVPFIARYRKEATASLDEVAITAVRDPLAQLRELSQRKDTIMNSLEERGLLTEELRQSILAAESMTALEDIYLPYRPKRRTRATIAREKGLEPLAHLMWDQGDIDPVREAAAYVDPEQGVETPEEALAGARDIMAEWVSEDTTARAQLRELFLSQGVLVSRVVKGKETLASKYRDYHNWEEPVATAPSHRVLAMMRGAGESLLTLHISPPEEQARSILEGLFVRGDRPASLQVQAAVHDSYKRLLAPSLETDVHHLIKERADEAAIQVFADNLRQLLLAPPLGNKNVMALDPAFAPVARWSAWIGKGSCFIEIPSTPCWMTAARRRQRRNWSACAAGFRLKPSPWVTARAAGRRKLLSGVWTWGPVFRW
jgi:uncharacterized protein